MVDGAILDGQKMLNFQSSSTLSLPNPHLLQGTSPPPLADISVTSRYTSYPRVFTPSSSLPLANTGAKAEQAKTSPKKGTENNPMLYPRQAGKQASNPRGEPSFPPSNEVIYAKQPSSSLPPFVHILAVPHILLLLQ